MISIIVPVYKVEPYLHQCIDSILKQTYRDIEILLIDDGSPDRCGKICGEYARTDNRIRVFHTENKGLSAARNLGLREAKGEYIGFVDSDDWIEPDMYEILLKRLEETNADISACEILVEYKKNRTTWNRVQNTVYTNAEIIQALVSFSFYNFTWNKLYKKSVWKGIEFPEGHMYEDVATLYRVLLKTHSVSCTSKPLYHYRMRKSGIMHTYSMKKIMDNWNAYFDRYSQLSAIPEFKNNQECMNKMEESLAEVATRIWQWVYCIPKEQRDYEFLKRISCLVREKIPLLGKNYWGLSLRLKVFFSRYVNDSIFALLYAFNTSKIVISFAFYQ